MRKSYILTLGLVVGFASMAQALTWTTNSPIPSGKRQMGVAWDGGTHIYSIGGRTGTDNAGSEVYLGTAGAAGALTWTTLNALPQPLAAPGAAIFNNRLYVWGGWTTGFPTVNTCYYAPINIDGTIGSWVTSAVTIPDQGGAVYADAFGTENMIFNGHLYIINGENNSAVFQNVALFNTIGGGGDYGTWTSTNEPGDAAAWFHGIAFFQGTSADYIYKVGGTDTLFSASPATIQSSTINGDGSLNAWSQQTGQLPAGKSEGGLAQFQNLIYLVGGTNDGSVTGTNTVFVGTIDAATGAVTWTTDSGTLPANRCRNRATVYKDSSGDYYIACIGGRLSDADPAEPTVFTALVASGAAVSDWMTYSE